ncbi:MAG: indolepyruvate ferredoxin oxidoreductase family protein [Pseudomonadota bacterium]
MATRAVSLSDKFDLSVDRVFASGTQALVRLMLMQKARDRQSGLNTAGYISGYRGSPLGGLDQQFVRAGKILQAENIIFQPGLNEDLAATSVWGAQQAEMRGEGAFDGVFGVWYGKGPGVDRTGDVFRHANLAGTSPNGGVLALMGDDHTCESSTTAHQSEFAMLDAMMPVLNPAGVQELLDFGLLGFALSRYSGCWVGFKCVKDTIESTASVDGRLDRVAITIPDDFEMPPGGLNIRPNDTPLEQEARLHDFKRFAAAAFVRANPIDRMVLSGGRSPKLGIVTMGKSYLDVMQALESLGIDEVMANKLGVRLFKPGCTWPLERDGIFRFAKGLEKIIVVEEKRSLVETQIKEQLYGTANAPVIVGKRDEDGKTLFPAKAALDLNHIALEIGRRIIARTPSEAVEASLERVAGFQTDLGRIEDVATRIPYFCAGCPHNSSTVVPEGSRAYAGIGCHYMVQWMDRDTEGYTHMGGEGANWIGEAPFSKRGHVFQNLGDGTYNHSGLMAIRAAAAAGVNITYKILFNDAVAMTGGQPNEGGLSVQQIAAQVAATGAKAIRIVTDEPDKYPNGTAWPHGTSVHHRDELNDVQTDLGEIGGLSVLIYDQTCAAEKRRRRKRGTFPDPDKRVFINELVCEGCGDCGKQSNCVAIDAVETEFGRKRRIDQSACNKDFYCLKGFCPSFVTVSGGKLKATVAKETTASGADFEVPAPPQADAAKPFAMMVTGVGGTGVVTVGAVIGMAAHLEGKGCGIVDMAGLAQKGGSVVSHLRIAPKPEDIKTITVPAGGADLVLGCDIMVVGSKKVLAAIRPGETQVFVNTHEALPGQFTQDPDYSLPQARLQKEIAKRAGRTANGAALFHKIDATRIARTLFADTILANMFMLGYAFQNGSIPLAAESIEQAIVLNGQAIERNQRAFSLGRLAMADPDVFAAMLPSAQDPDMPIKAETLDEIVARRKEFLTGYQNGAYAERYGKLVEQVRIAEAKLPGKPGDLSLAVAKYLFKLMAYKDEYEVARLYTEGSFARSLKETFEGDLKLTFHLAPPVLSKPDGRTGAPRKREFGAWILPLLRLLAPLKVLRGTAFDVFGRTEERRMERQLRDDYEELITRFTKELTSGNYDVAVALAELPERIRGYGHVKARHLAEIEHLRDALLAQFDDAPRALPQAAE